MYWPIFGAEVKAIVQALQSLSNAPMTLKILRPQEFLTRRSLHPRNGGQCVHHFRTLFVLQEVKISMSKKPNTSLGLQMNFTSFSAGWLCRVTSVKTD